MRANPLIVALFGVFMFALPAWAGEAETVRQYLSGLGKDDAVKWEFTVSDGMRAGERATIPVPSNWELHRFGIYNYGHDLGRPSAATRPASRDAAGNPIKPFKPPVTGTYRHTFDVPSAWDGRRVFIVFEGAQTDTDVRINGQSAGPTHRGGFYRFEYEITPLVKFGQTNALEAVVTDESAEPSINGAERRGDYWNFGGIFRPVYLEARPQSYIDRVAIDASADGALTLEVFPKGADGTTAVEAQVVELDGKTVGEAATAPVAGDVNTVKLTQKLAGVRQWTAETPNLYLLRVRLKQNDKVLHEITQRFGFRTVELRPGDGIYVNDKRILLKGACRHSFWPDSGRCLSEKVSEDDIRLIQDLNMNAVRMSHYPPDQHFLDKCDEMGLYVLDELAGWQGAYATETARRLVGEMVPRDVNHPSILFWDNGNENGWNTAVDGDFALYDPQRRHVLHPWEIHDGTNTKHYPSPADLKKGLAGPNVYFPTECQHGMYDGGGGAGLFTVWEAIRKSKVGGGAFLWALLDEGVVRADRGGAIDTHGNHAPDGVVGPYRQREGSFYAVKEIWSPVVVRQKEGATPANLVVENRYDFTDLRQCTFRWEARQFRKAGDDLAGSVVVQDGTIPGPAVAPGGVGELKLPTDLGTGKIDAVAVRAIDPRARELWTWVFPVSRPGDAAGIFGEPAANQAAPKVDATEDGDAVTLASKTLTVNFSKKSGELTSLTSGRQALSLANGPRRVGTAGKLEKTSMALDESAAIFTATYADQTLTTRWTLTPDGRLKLDFQYQIPEGTKTHLAGITFDYPEKNVKSKKWLGNGPFRVWQNRPQGGTLDVWETNYNDTVTGQTWDYPEFKGYFSNVRWMRLETTEGPITFAVGSDDTIVRLFTPSWPQYPTHTKVAFPPGDISFLHGIPPIGDKFRDADMTRTVPPGTYKGTVWFQFGR